MNYSRREFNKLAAASLPLAALKHSHAALLLSANKPNSVFNGVRIGVITPYSYHNMPNDAQSLLDCMVADNISSTEIQCPPVEEWAGAPKAPPVAARPVAMNGA